MLYGNYQDLPPALLKQLKKLENRKSTPGYVISPELGRLLLEVSGETGRQTGLLLDRGGLVQCVVVGLPEEITIPALSRFRALPGRLRGLRFIRTEPYGGGEPDGDDVADLALLRLDSLSVLTGYEGIPSKIKTIHLLPPDPGVLVPYGTFDIADPHRNIGYEAFIEALETEINTKTKALYTVKAKHAALLVGVFQRREGMGEHMEELAELAKSGGYDVLGVETQIRQVHPRTVVGGGKLRDIIISALIKGADTIIFDNNLSPAQMKLISSITEITIMDRTQLILEIFGQRAKSNEGKIRVELARLKYFMPYLTGRDDSLSRIAGGEGGEGSKGPGETKLELDRRHISERISFLSNKIKKIESTRTTQRKRRERNKVPVISIIGYTNAGKSTLLNKLTQANTYADDRLFATLDTSSKRIRFPQDKEVIITDTVGFIRDLPKDLFGAFKSTLEELAEADVLLHVVDGSSHFAEEHIRSVREVIKELKVEQPELVVFNKSDLISAAKMDFLLAAEPDALFISALDRKTLTPMVERLDELLSGTD